MNENNMDYDTCNDMQSTNTQKDKCIVCKQEITRNDLIHFSGNVRIHFKCYIDIQEKLCGMCGKPFLDQEELYFCIEHKEYFHKKGPCLWQHLHKHMPFKEAKYDARKNRITISENL